MNLTNLTILPLTFAENMYGMLHKTHITKTVAMIHGVYSTGRHRGWCLDKGFTIAMHLSTVIMTSSQVELVDIVMKRYAAIVHSV